MRTNVDIFPIPTGGFSSDTHTLASPLLFPLSPAHGTDVFAPPTYLPKSPFLNIAFPRSWMTMGNLTTVETTGHNAQLRGG